MRNVIRTITIAAVLLILAGVNVHAGYTPEYPTGLSGWGRIPIRISDPAGEEV